MNAKRSTGRSNHVGRWRHQLAAWMAERALEDRLRGPEDPGPDEEPAPTPSPRRLYVLQRNIAGRLGTGDIVILRPPAGAVRWGPVYGVLLEATSEGRWLLVPFSRYATPAVPGEWKTGLTADALRVLCLWNAREVEAGLILPGRTKKMSERWVQATRTRYRHVMYGEALPGREGIRFGPPLVHPADDRYTYLEEEMQRLNEHGLVPSGQSTGTMPEQVPVPDQRSGWLLAAEGRPGYKPER